MENLKDTLMPIVNNAIDNIMTFNTDNEFCDFCLCKNPTIEYHSDVDVYTQDYDYTPEYLKAVEQGVKFKLLEPGSKILKRKCVCKGIVNKPVENIYDKYCDCND